MMQVFVRGYCTMIAAPVQCDVDGIPKGSHYARVALMPDSAMIAAVVGGIRIFVYAGWERNTAGRRLSASDEKWSDPGF